MSELDREILRVVDRGACLELDEVAYQANKTVDAPAERVVNALKRLEEQGLVSVQILVRLTQEGRNRVA